MKIVIDPGHGGRDPGAIGANGCHEELINLKIAGRVKALLENYHDVSITRVFRGLSSNHELSLAARVKMAENSDLLVSIHCNAHTDPKARGIEVFYYPGSVPGLMAAQKVLIYAGETIEAIAGYRIPNRGAKANREFYLLNRTVCPAILIECGFISNPDECKLLTSPLGEIAFGAAIAAALL